MCLANVITHPLREHLYVILNGGASFLNSGSGSGRVSSRRVGMATVLEALEVPELGLEIGSDEVGEATVCC